MELMECLESSLTENPGQHNALVDARALKAALGALSPCE